jgi:hypothetical protein
VNNFFCLGSLRSGVAGLANYRGLPLLQLAGSKGAHQEEAEKKKVKKSTLSGKEGAK